MRNERKKRKRIARSNSKACEGQLQLEATLRAQAEKKLILYKNMCRSYYDRWHSELAQRKELMLQQRKASYGFDTKSLMKVTIKIQEINPKYLKDPTDNAGNSMPTYIGRGSFAVVQLQIYRGLKVAVKRLLPSTARVDVDREAQILAQLCHPYLPYLFGVVTSVLPYRIIMQYHGLSNKKMSVTLSDVLIDSTGLSDHMASMICAQLTEAVDYLHENVNILHNDLKCNNILICDGLVGVEGMCDTQTVVIDFGKATSIDSGKTYRLNDVEKAEYFKKYPYIAPEVIEGMSCQSKMSDIYSLGCIFHKICDHGGLTNKDYCAQLSDLATKCRVIQSYKRKASWEASRNYLLIIKLCDRYCMTLL